jgi:hypothetical protein
MFMLILINLLVLASSSILARNFFKIILIRDYILTVFLLCLTQIILIELLLGNFGALYLNNIFIGYIVIFISACMFFPPRNKLIPDKPEIEFLTSSKLLLLALSVFSAFFLVKSLVNLITPPVCPDSLQYHLSFPATWLRSGKLDNPFVIFQGIFNQTQPRIEVSGVSYFPINAELLFLWLMLPLRNAFLADFAQSIFYVIGVIAVYSILRKYGINKSIALLSGFLWVLIPNIFKQLKNGSQTDVICSVLLLLVWNELLLLKEGITYKKVILFGISMGIFVGVKFFNIIWLVAFLPLIIYILFKGFQDGKFHFGRITCFSIAAISMILLFGGYVYIKNLIATGNPLFPNEVRVFGNTIFKGLVDSVTYNKLYAPDNRLELGKFIFKEGLGVQFPALILPGLALPFIFFVYFKRNLQPFGEYVILSIIPIAMFILYALFANAYLSRYLFPFLTAGLVIAIIFISKLPGGIKYIRFVGFICIIASACELAHKYELVVSLLLSSLFFVVLFINRKRIVIFYKSKFFIPTVFILFASGLILMFYLNWRYDREEFDRYLLTFSRKEAWQVDIARGWKKLNELTGKGSRVAYTGRQEFYPLFGTKLKNDVKYISVNSQEALPYKSLDGNCRKVKDFVAWRENLRKENIEYLFIALPFPDNRESEDPTKFPIEDDWAGAHPENFQLLYSNSLSRIYKVTIPSR